MTHRLPLTVRLEHFEGPLDLLLHLIQSQELDISKVAITKITDQYLACIHTMLDHDFDVAGDFLLMAATLIYWKSKALLPQENDNANADGANDDGILSPEDLIRQLLEHQRFLAAGEDLAQLPRLYEDLFLRPNSKPPIERIWKEMNLSDLTLTYQDSITRARRRKQVLRKETVSIGEKIHEFNAKLEVGKPTELSVLMGFNPTRADQVVTFLASLEIARLKKMRLYQQLTYDPIFIELLERITLMEVTLAGADFEKKPESVAEEPSPTPSPQEIL